MAGVNMVQGKKDDSLDLAVKGLQAYGTVSGIRKDMAQTDAAKATSDATQATAMQRRIDKLSTPYRSED